MTGHGTDRGRIVWVNHHAAAPSSAGGTRHFEISRELARRGWTPAIVASDFLTKNRAYSRRKGWWDLRVSEDRLDGVLFRWLWAFPYRTNNWRRALNWLTFATSLHAARIGRTRPEVVIGSSPHLIAAWAALRIARTHDIPFVFEVRDLWPESLIAAGGREGAFFRWLERISAMLYREADAIMALSRGTMDYLEERGVPGERLHYVPNGVDPGLFFPRCTTSREPFTLMYVGAHGPANGLDVVLDVAEMLNGSGRVRFVLVGDGPEKERLVRRASQMRLSNVEFRPAVPKQDVPDLLTGADAGLMILKEAPLFAFGVSPNKLFDYMAAGLPILCNVPGEVAGMVREAGAGIQAGGSDPAALHAAVIQLLEKDGEERLELGRNGRRWVEENHSRQQLADRMEAMLQAVLRGRK